MGGKNNTETGTASPFELPEGVRICPPLSELMPIPEEARQEIIDNAEYILKDLEEYSYPIRTIERGFINSDGSYIHYTLKVDRD